jgi:hypothetical protein
MIIRALVAMTAIGTAARECMRSPGGQRLLWPGSFRPSPLDPMMLLVTLAGDLQAAW